MLKVLRNEGNKVFYKCDCGIKGKCIIKPLGKAGDIVLDIRCPVCEATERVQILQGHNEEGDFTWACVLLNEITDYEVKEEL